MLLFFLMFSKALIGSTATLVGYIIGAGILALPFAFGQVGYLTGAALVVFLGFGLMILYLYLGEVVLRTKGNHQIPGLAERYLGAGGKWVMYLAMILGGYGSLTAYMIKEGDFLQLLFSPLFGGNSLLYSYAFFLIGALLLYIGLRLVEKVEVLLVALIILVVGFVFAFTLPLIQPEAVWQFDISKVFVPYGVIFFAFMGIGAIPEMHAELIGRYRILKHAIILGTLIPMIVYLLFPFSIVGSAGPEGVSEGTIEGLQRAVGRPFFMVALFFGMLTMATSFLAVGLAVKEVFRFDSRISETRSWVYTIIGPLALFHLMRFSGVEHAFFKIIDITGAVSGSIIGIVVVLMFWRAKQKGNREPEFEVSGNRTIGWLLIGLFVVGMVLDLLRLW